MTDRQNRLGAHEAREVIVECRRENRRTPDTAPSPAVEGRSPPERRRPEKTATKPSASITGTSAVTALHQGALF
ncbi:hypothetical protein [Kitasatospora sp. NPDC086791]|uniref:hypothetical protein n=1 Tax=Kitasatospora sp. NPDC086791 TaxID=3155178 RepID=UPI0034334556